jgi:hypothetical protein
MKNKKGRYPKGMSIFLNAFIKDILALPVTDPNRVLLSLRATLDGTPKPAAPLPQTLSEIFITDLFDAFGELCQAYENVLLVVELARLRFKKTNRITRLRYLTFVADSSLNEFYIFTERLNKFLTNILRRYSKDPKFASLQIFVHKAIKIVKNSLQTTLQIRSEHVHERRFSSSDEKIKRIATLELLVVNGGMKKFRPIYRKAMSAAYRHIIQQTKIHARNAKAVSGAVLKNLARELIDGNGQLRYPSNIKRQN